MMILALDLGKFKSVFCRYPSQSVDATYGTIPTTPQAVHDLLVDQQPDRLVIEANHIAGWIHDMAETLGMEIQVANSNTEGWRWKHVKRKTDRDDALKLAKLSAMDQLPQVHVPACRVRQWRALIAYRHKLVSRRTAIRNSIRALLDTQGLSIPRRASGWTKGSMLKLAELAKSIESCDMDELWRGQLHLELEAYAQLQPSIEQVESKLDALGKCDARVGRLRTIPGVGPRLSEVVVAWIDDPGRFRTGRQVGAYAGLVPKQHQSGTHDRLGRITRHGPGLLRKLLVEIAWAMQLHNPDVKALFDKLCRGEKTKRKQAAVAVARRILIWCWAMLRDETNWQPQRIRAAA